MNINVISKVLPLDITYLRFYLGEEESEYLIDDLLTLNKKAIFASPTGQFIISAHRGGCSMEPSLSPSGAKELIQDLETVAVVQGLSELSCLLKEHLRYFVSTNSV